MSDKIFQGNVTIGSDTPAVKILPAGDIPAGARALIIGVGTTPTTRGANLVVMGKTTTLIYRVAEPGQPIIPGGVVEVPIAEPYEPDGIELVLLSDNPGDGITYTIGIIVCGVQ